MQHKLVLEVLERKLVLAQRTLVMEQRMEQRKALHKLELALELEEYKLKF